jgi:ribosomal protein S27E
MEDGMQVLNYDPVDPDKMKLPVGLTCGDCAHIARCKAMFGHTESDVSCDWSPSRFISKPAPTVAKLPPMTPQEIASTLRGIAKDSEGKIILADVLTLNYLADQVEAMACQHTNTELYHFDATRSSGSCNDCGADVRTPAQ